MPFPFAGILEQCEVSPIAQRRPRHLAGFADPAPAPELRRSHVMVTDARHNGHLNTS